MHAVTDTGFGGGMAVTDSPLIRPRDPAIAGRTLRVAPYDSAEATRRFVDLAFRDALTAIDLTHARGGCWRRPYPPDLALTTNNLDPSSDADVHLDFTATGLPDAAYDLAVIDPPHLADLGSDSIMGRRFGTVRGTPALRLLVTEGIREAWRIARVGILVKLADHCHGGEFLQLTQWAYDELGAALYFSAHTYRAPVADGRRRVQRVPLNNSADWLVFRKDGGAHKDFDRLYDRQQASRISMLTSAPRCVMCDTRMDGRRSDALTCSDACRQRARRERRKVSRLMEIRPAPAQNPIAPAMAGHTVASLTGRAPSSSSASTRTARRMSEAVAVAGVRPAPAAGDGGWTDEDLDDPPF